MNRCLPIVVALPLVLAAGFVHGRWTDRWTVNTALAAAVARLDRVPMQLGDWRGHDQKLTTEVVAKAGLDGYLLRRYESARHGAITMLLVCGRPGPISAHTPEVCYGGAGFEPRSEPVRQTLANDESSVTGDFFSAVYVRPRQPDQADLRLLWAWNGNGTWEVADNPRLSFAPYRSLYKIYITRETTRDDRLSATRDLAADFARQLLPVLKEALF